MYQFCTKNEQIPKIKLKLLAHLGSKETATLRKPRTKGLCGDSKPTRWCIR